MKIVIVAVIVLICFSANAEQWPSGLITKPEKTAYQETSTYQDVINFISEVQKGSSHVTEISLGSSFEGKNIPVLVLANPKISYPEEAKTSGKPIIYIQGNIHAGEVEGKEVIQILLREILHGSKSHLLDNQIILFAPIYNTDSNDKMATGHRTSQEGSPIETGLRANSQGWDLNRDGIKMEALETRGLIQNIILPWDPTLFVDLHTTNGTWHGYSLTWAPSYHYAGEKAPYDFTWDKLLPQVTDKVKKNHRIHLGPYANYSIERQGWPIQSITTYNHHPRYLVNQFSLRNRMAILSEAFAHERFYQRMNSTHAFLTEILEFTNKNGQEMLAINAQTEADAIQLVREQGGKVKKGVRFKKIPLEEPIAKYRTYDHHKVISADGQISYLRTPNIIELHNVINNSAFEATLESTLPLGYIIPAELTSIAQHLKAHGTIVTPLTENISATGEVFTIRKIIRTPSNFQGHHMLTIEGGFAPTTKKFKQGDFIIDLAQPLANLIFYMLEPQSDDGLVTWNFFDDYFEDNKNSDGIVEYPVFKYFEIK